MFALADPLGRVLAAAATAVLAAGPTVLVPVPSRPSGRAHPRARPDAPDRPRRGAASLRRDGAAASGRAPARGARPRARPGRARLAPAGRQPGRLDGGAARRARRRWPGPACRSRSCVCDDVLTTGATAREAQRALEDSGLPVRAVVTVAATRKRLPRRECTTCPGPTAFGHGRLTSAHGEHPGPRSHRGAPVGRCRILGTLDPFSHVDQVLRAARTGVRAGGLRARGQESPDNQIVTRFDRTAREVCGGCRGQQPALRGVGSVPGACRGEARQAGEAQPPDHPGGRAPREGGPPARTREDRPGRADSEVQGTRRPRRGRRRGQDGRARPGAGQDGRADAPRRRPQEGPPRPAQARVARPGDGAHGAPVVERPRRRARRRAQGRTGHGDRRRAARRTREEPRRPRR